MTNPDLAGRAVGKGRQKERGCNGRHGLRGGRFRAQDFSVGGMVSELEILTGTRGLHCGRMGYAISRFYP